MEILLNFFFISLKFLFAFIDIECSLIGMKMCLIFCYKSVCSLTFELVTKMVPLEYNQKLCELFGFCPRADGSAQVLTFAKRCVILWLLVGMDVIPTLHFLYTHFDDPALLISAISPITAFTVGSVSYLTFAIEGKRAVYIYSYLRTLVNERKL